MLPSAVNDTMRDMMAQIRDCGDGVRDGTYTMTAPKITGGTITGVTLTGNTFSSPVISGGTINNATIGATTATTGKFSTLTNSALTSGRITYAGASGLLSDSANLTYNGTALTVSASSAISGIFNRTTSSGATVQIQVVGGSVGTLGSDTGGNGVFDIVAASSMFLRSTGANSRMVFSTNNAEAMTLDSSGNLGLKVTPSAWGSTAYIAMQFPNGGSLSGYKGSVAPILNLSSNLYFDDTNDRYVVNGAATRYSQNQGVHSWSNAASGTAGNIITFTQAMTLDTSGNLLLGTTSTTVNPGIVVYGGINNAQIQIGHASGVASGEGYIGFQYNGSAIGSITQNGTTGVLYNVTSDQRLKTNVVDATSGNIDDIKVRSFDWIADGSHQEYGMVAQELIEVAPYAVNKPENPDEMMGVDYSKLVPMMIKEIQDLKQRIATLENK
jgi:hypothetical protein